MFQTIWKLAVLRGWVPVREGTMNPPVRLLNVKKREGMSCEILDSL